MFLFNAFGGLPRNSATRRSGSSPGAGGRPRGRRRPHPYRPHVDVLEDRLPPGDAVLGGLLAWSWSEPAVPLRQPGLLASQSELTAESPARLRVLPWDRELSAPAGGARLHAGAALRADNRTEGNGSYGNGRAIQTMNLLKPIGSNPVHRDSPNLETGLQDVLAMPVPSAGLAHGATGNGSR